MRTFVFSIHASAAKLFTTTRRHLWVVVVDVVVVVVGTPSQTIAVARWNRASIRVRTISHPPTHAYSHTHTHTDKATNHNVSTLSRLTTTTTTTTTPHRKSFTNDNSSPYCAAQSRASAAASIRLLVAHTTNFFSALLFSLNIISFALYVLPSNQPPTPPPRRTQNVQNDPEPVRPQSAQSFSYNHNNEPPNHHETR